MVAGMIDQSNLANIATLRVFCAGKDGCTASDLKNELAPLVTHKLSQGEWRQAFNSLLETLIKKGTLEEVSRGRYVASTNGQENTLSFLGLKKLPANDWKEIKAIYLVAIAWKFRQDLLKSLNN